ncbi:MAG: Tripartite tricarboxylate transporter TctA family, partial [uncultured Microvirga sp.]
ERHPGQCGARLRHRAVVEQSSVLPTRRHARDRDRRAARARARGHHRAPPADHLPHGRDRLPHSSRRHLLRRHVWRLDHLDPGQGAGRGRIRGHLPRRLRHGAQGQGRRGAGALRLRLLYRRRDRHGRGFSSRATARGSRAGLWPGRIRRPCDRRPRARDPCGAEHAGRLARDDRGGPASCHPWRRPDLRHRALHLRTTRSVRRRPGRDPGHGPVRHRRAIDGRKFARWRARAGQSAGPSEGTAAEPRRVEPIGPGHRARHRPWVLSRAPARRRRADRILRLLRHRKAALAAPRALRPGSAGRGGRAGIRQQRGRAGRLRTAPQSRHPGQRRHGRDDGWAPDPRHPARPAAPGDAARPLLGRDLFDAHWQCHADHPQRALDLDLRAASAHSFRGALAAHHPVLRRRGVLAAQQRFRRRPDGRLRRDRLAHAAGEIRPGPAGSRLRARRHSGALRPPGAAGRAGLAGDFPAAPDLGGAPGPRRRPAPLAGASIRLGPFCACPSWPRGFSV